MLPTISHVDHTEHDIKCIVTEHGYATNFAVRSPRARAREVIDRCAHPYFRPLLYDSLNLSGGGDEPRLAGLQAVEDWWRRHDEACAAFPR